MPLIFQKTNVISEENSTAEFWKF